MQSIRRTSSSATLSLPVIELLKRPLATQLATVNPSGSPQQTIMDVDLQPWYERVCPFSQPPSTGLSQAQKWAQDTRQTIT
jgi:hypothetical protein